MLFYDDWLISEVTIKATFSVAVEETLITIIGHKRLVVRVTVTAGVEPRLSIALFRFLLLSQRIIDQLQLFHESAFFESCGRSHALLSPTWDDLLIEVAMGLLDLILVEVVYTLDIPKALANVADTA